LNNKAIVDIGLCQRCAIQLPFSADNTTRPTLAIKHLPLRGPVQLAIHRNVRHVMHIFSSQIAPSCSGIVTPRNTLFLGPSLLIIPNGISIGSAVFVWVPNVMLYNALTIRKKTQKIALSPWDFITHPAGGGPSHGHRQHTQKW